MNKKTIYLKDENYNWKQFEYESIEDLKSEFESLIMPFIPSFGILIYPLLSKTLVGDCGALRLTHRLSHVSIIVIMGYSSYSRLFHHYRMGMAENCLSLLRISAELCQAGHLCF